MTEDINFFSLLFPTLLHVRGLSWEILTDFWFIDYFRYFLFIDTNVDFTRPSWCSDNHDLPSDPLVAARAPMITL